MKQKDLTDGFKDLSEVTRLVLMVELEPLSDTYVQVVFDRDTFKKISDAAWRAMPLSKRAAPGEDMRDIQTRPMKPVVIPDLEDFYPPKTFGN